MHGCIQTDWKNEGKAVDGGIKRQIAAYTNRQHVFALRTPIVLSKP
jgi:hypothetical protein